MKKTCEAIGCDKEFETLHSIYERRCRACRKANKNYKDGTPLPPKHRKGSSLKRRRTRLWKQDKRCYYCGIETVLPENFLSKSGRLKVTPKNLATIEHLRSRLNPHRTEKNKGNEIRRVLACWQCNQERGAQEVNNIDITLRWKWSGRFPKLLTL